MKIIKHVSLALMALCALALLGRLAGLPLPDALVRVLGVVTLMAVFAFSFCWGRERMHKA